MASPSGSDGYSLPAGILENVKKLLWGSDIKCEVFRRWTQGFEFSEDEPTALLQHEGGPCAIIAPVQGYLLKNLLFTSENRKENWRELTEQDREELMMVTIEDILTSVASTESYFILSHRPDEDTEQSTEMPLSSDDGESSPKKRRVSHEQFHEGLWCYECRNKQELHSCLVEHIPQYYQQYGVLLLLYSLVLTKGVDQIKNEVEDASEPLIDGMHGHGSQSLINLLLTTKAVTNVWDNDKDVSGLKLRGISEKARIGFLTLLEHLRYCEVGWYMKNPEFSIWLLGSETHLTVLFSVESSLVSQETPQAQARRVFGQYDTEECGFVNSGVIGDILQTLDLVSEPEYVKIMVEKMDPEQLGIVTLQSFMETFFPNASGSQVVESFNLYHYNGLKRSCANNKVMYQECTAVLLEQPETQLITDTSPIKTCLMTKWPTIEIQWKNNVIPSLN